MLTHIFLHHGMKKTFLCRGWPGLTGGVYQFRNPICLWVNEINQELRTFSMSDQYVLAVDQGTGSTKALIFNSSGEIASKATVEISSRYPRPGFVEQDPNEIYQSALDSVRLCIRDFTGKSGEIVACGISNQRETIVLWDPGGEPLYNAVVWQCKRSVDICNRLKDSTAEREINTRTGLIVDPYFSGTKVVWLYENVPEIKRAIQRGDAYMGTVETWLLFKLTGGASYFTDFTNASRTLFFNINTLKWDDYLLKYFKLGHLNLPEPRPSTWVFGKSDFEGLFDHPLPITSLIGDSHAAAFGEGAFSAGDAKASLGTGASVLLNTGNKVVHSKNGMVSTICWSTRERVDYALEGMIVSCGATIKWLRDQLGLFHHNHEIEPMALKAAHNHGVYLVPAFAGLAGPYWKMEARGMITGLTFGNDKSHIIRAALESVCYQVKDIISAMEKDSDVRLRKLMVDGGLTANRFVMQFLADLLQSDVVNIGMEEVSALGAAYMAGLQMGFFRDFAQLSQLNVTQVVFSPGHEAKEAARSYQGWLDTLNGIFGKEGSP